MDRMHRNDALWPLPCRLRASAIRDGVTLVEVFMLQPVNPPVTVRRAVGSIRARRITSRPCSLPLEAKRPGHPAAFSFHSAASLRIPFAPRPGFRRASFTRSTDFHGPLTFVSGSAGRIAELTRDGTVVEAYAHDANGNRMRATYPTGTLTGSVDAQGRAGNPSPTFPAAYNGNNTGTTSSVASRTRSCTRSPTRAKSAAVYFPGPMMRRLTGVATGVAKEVEAAMATVIMIG